MNNEVTTTLNYFSGCYLKFIVPWEYPKHISFEVQNILHKLQLASRSSTLFPFSVESEQRVSNKRRQGGRFSSCFIHTFVDAHANNFLLILLGRLPEFEGQVVEKPNHLIFFTTLELMPEFFGFYKTFVPQMYSTGITLLITNNLQHINFICISCPNNQDRFYKLSLNEMKTRRILETTWKILNSNLFQAPIYSLITTPITLERYTASHCDELAKIVPDRIEVHVPHLRVCVMKVLQQKFNFSVSNELDLNRFIGDIQNVQLSTQLMKMKGIDYLPYGLIFERFSYIIVENSTATYQWTLFKPFDTLTWICFLASAFTLLIFAAYCNGTGNISTNFFSILASALDQPFLYASDVNKYPNYRLIWGIMTLVLSGAYKGKIFSFLSKSSVLNWPENIGEVLSKDYIKITLTNAVTMYQGRPIVVGSNLHEMLAETNVNSSDNLFAMLEKETVHYQEPENLFLSKVIASHADKNSLNFKPSHLAIVDANGYILRLKRAFMVLAKDKSVSDLKDISGITASKVWTAYSNFFKPFFANVLGQLLESGIFMRWAENQALAESLALINEVNTTTNDLYNISMEFRLPAKFFIRYMKASILEQTLLNTSDLNKFPIYRLTWGIAILILSGAYKGKMFSYLSKSSAVIWPDNIGEKVTANKSPAGQMDSKFKSSRIAIMDANGCILRLKRAFMVLAKDKSVSHPKGIFTGLSSTVVWIAYSNFFKPFFENGLANLVESGIFMRWAQNHALAESLALITEVNRTTYDLYNISMEFRLPAKFFIRYMKASILDQPFLHSSDLNKFPNYILIWGIVTLILSGAYKGMMYSYLSKSSALIWPNNIVEVLGKDYTKVSLTTAYNIHQGKPVPVGCFLHTVLLQASGNSSHNVFSKLDKQIVHYQGFENKFLSNVISNERRRLKFKPSHLAIVDRSACILRLKRAFMVLAKDKSVSDPKVISGLIDITVWIVYSNFFKPIFTNGLAQLEESGILLRWAAEEISNKSAGAIQYFRNCHFKFNLPHLFQDSPFRIVVLSLLGELSRCLTTTISIQTDSFESKEYAQIRRERFYSCSLRIYVEIEKHETAVNSYYEPPKLPVLVGRSFPHTSPFKSLLEKPNHLIFLNDLESKTVNILQKLIKQKVQHSNGIVILTDLLQHFHLICITCENFLQKVDKGYFENPQKLLSTWKELHANLNNALILSRVTEMEIKTHEIEHCNIVKNTSQISTEPPLSLMCALLFLKIKLNFSITFDDKNKKNTGFVELFALYPQNIKALFRMTNVAHIPHASAFDAFSFIIIQNKPKHRFGLLNPFDMVTNFCLIGSMVAILLIGKWFMGSWIVNFLSIAASLLDQPLIFGSHLQKLPLYGIVWLTMVTVLSAAYKGKVFTLLTKELDPLWPETLREVLNGRYSIVTITPTYYITDGKLHENKSLLGEMLTELRKKPNSEYGQLDESYIYLKARGKELVQEIVNSDRHNRNVSSLAIIDKHPYITKLKQTLKILTDTKVVSNPTMIKVITVTHIWICDNFFNHLFTRGLAQLQQSGIWNR
ncbi:unnamed protein product [Orchesella dallaii]|uniref:Uncharacterized protein n=1 Tax=Orchesella dallaii TaxID=48710 RepID=A0ABP1RHS2_9HEXA